MCCVQSYYRRRWKDLWAYREYRVTFKKRYYGHTANFRDANCRKGSGLNKGTALSAKFWEIKDMGKTPKIKWGIIDRASVLLCHQQQVPHGFISQ